MKSFIIIPLLMFGASVFNPSVNLSEFKNSALPEMLQPAKISPQEKTDRLPVDHKIKLLEKQYRLSQVIASSS